MFTGIITDLGRVRAVTPGGDTRFEIATALAAADIETGASVCCSGVCLTVVDGGNGDGDGAGEGRWFAATVSGATLAATTLGQWRAGTPVNLEGALRTGDALGGHMVSGHVDGVAAVVEAAPEGDSRRLVFEAADGLEASIAAKGSVALDGVSLTVNEVRGRQFGVNVIPHTLTATTLGGLVAGDRVNLEIDILARYVARLLGKD